MIKYICMFMLNSLRLSQWKTNLKAEAFQFFLFKQHLEWMGLRCSHSYMRREKANNETTVWKPGEVIFRRQCRTFYLTQKKKKFVEDLIILQKKKNKGKEKKMNIYFPFGEFWSVNWNFIYLCSSNHRTTDIWLPQSHSFSQMMLVPYMKKWST